MLVYAKYGCLGHMYQKEEARQRTDVDARDKWGKLAEKIELRGGNLASSRVIHLGRSSLPIPTGNLEARAYGASRRVNLSFPKVAEDPPYPSQKWQKTPFNPFS